MRTALDVYTLFVLAMAFAAIQNLRIAFVHYYNEYQRLMREVMSELQEEQSK